MRKLFPHPFVSLGITLMWLILNKFSLGHLLLGLMIALVAGWGLGRIQPSGRRLRKPHLLVKLFFVVGWDIIRSNAAVAWLIITNGRHGKRHSDFIEVPLQLKDRMGLAVLSFIVTATPGSIWIKYDPTKGTLLLHVFDLVDEAAWRHMLKNKYEKLLMEIYE